MIIRVCVCLQDPSGGGPPCLFQGLESTRAECLITIFFILTLMKITILIVTITIVIIFIFIIIPGCPGSFLEKHLSTAPVRSSAFQESHVARWFGSSHPGEWRSIHEHPDPPSSFGTPTCDSWLPVVFFGQLHSTSTPRGPLASAKDCIGFSKRQSACILTMFTTTKVDLSQTGILNPQTNGLLKARTPALPRGWFCTDSKGTRISSLQRPVKEWLTSWCSFHLGGIYFLGR